MARARQRLVILFPGLFDLIASHHTADFAQEFPKLSRLINRGRIEDDHALALERVIVASCGIEGGSGRNTDLLESLASVDEVPFCANLLRADPVHLRADGVQLRLFSGPHFEPDEVESKRLLEDLASLYPEYQFYRGRFPGRWYIKLPERLVFDVEPASALQQLAIEQHLPQGADAKKAHLLMNEIQMAMNQSTVNETREARGQSPINSVWLWGPAAPAKIFKPQPLTIWGDDILAYALTQRFGIMHLNTEGHPRGMTQILQNLRHDGLNLVLLNHPSGPISQRASDITLLEFERAWAAVIFNMLATMRLKSLEILDNRRRLLISSVDCWKFWRRTEYFAQRLKVAVDPTKLSSDIVIDES